ncbi:hypothetical protein KOY49_01710 [Candidatus Minimicrobia vallesae]|uniref:Uncharacterized protein n=1 Tax=Candidatus Minimicrobia vallesae TaxID=2841264 RepID=A0A8F1SB98_9BACT|nr:hypothetical protein [Candidatus Minimicrobia vallesae]QWQ31706.1 hypothetical protein KOY49_01710 [Candidatus Minimicrobia vallesae]
MSGFIIVTELSAEIASAEEYQIVDLKEADDGTDALLLEAVARNMEVLPVQLEQ